MYSRASGDGAAEAIAEVAAVAAEAAAAAAAAPEAAAAADAAPEAAVSDDGGSPSAAPPPEEDGGSAMDLASSSASDAGSDWGAADPAEVEAALREIRPLTILRAPPPPGDAAAHAETVFYLLGTAHVSKQSAADAVRLVAAVRPETVMLELCHDRRALLSADFDAAAREVPLGEALADIASGRATAFTALYGWLLARLGAGLECQPGAEFRAACRAAHECGAAVVLGDRPLSATLARVWAALAPWEKARLAGQLLWTGFAAAPEDLAAELEAMKVGLSVGTSASCIYTIQLSFLRTFRPRTNLLPTAPPTSIATSIKSNQSNQSGDRRNDCRDPRARPRLPLTRAAAPRGARRVHGPRAAAPCRPRRRRRRRRRGRPFARDPREMGDGHRRRGAVRAAAAAARRALGPARARRRGRGGGRARDCAAAAARRVAGLNSHGRRALGR
jgi:hypothetical protein